MKKLKKFLQPLLHTFFPTTHNNNVPHILENSSIVAISIVALLLFAFNNKNVEISRNLDLTAAVYPAVINDLTNQDRAEEGLKKLAWSDKLASAAYLKAEDMFKNQYFAHTSPSGITPWYWFKEIKYSFTYAGENLAIRYDDSKDLEEAWLDSPTHRANVLSDKFTEMGVAAVDGIYEGEETTIVVELFGSPAFIPASTPPPVPTPTPSPVAVAVAPTPAPAPSVAGAETEKKTVKKPTTPTQIPDVGTSGGAPLETVMASKTFLVVKSNEPVQAAPSSSNILNRSNWFEKFIVSPAASVRSIYILIVSALLAAITLMLFKAYESHHFKHFNMGLSAVALVLVLLYLMAPGGISFALGL